MKQIIYLAANCGCASGVGHWVADSYPENFRWVVSFQGKRNCTDAIALLARAAIKALADLETRCDVILRSARAFIAALADLETRCDVILRVSDDRFAAFVLGHLEGRIDGLPLATQEELFYQLERHNVAVEVLHLATSPQAKAIIQRLEEELQ